MKTFLTFAILSSLSFFNEAKIQQNDEVPLMTIKNISTHIKPLSLDLVPYSHSETFIFPEYVSVKNFSDCSASCGNKSCSGSGNCVCSCSWFRCRCTTNPNPIQELTTAMIYLSEENYLQHRKFAQMLYTYGEESGIAASKIIAEWVADVFETKGEKAGVFEKNFFEVMTPASKELKNKVNDFFEANGVNDRV